MLERKYLAHFLDASFGGQTTNYVRLGDDLEELTIELNPEIDQFRNILGEGKVRNQGYEPSADVSPYYATIGDDLFEQLFAIVDGRLTGEDVETTVVDVVYNTDGTVYKATREDVKVIPSGFGGDSSGVQIPFTYYYNGNRTNGTWTQDSSTGAYSFTPTT